VDTPEYQTVATKANEFLARTGLQPQDLASRLGIGESTLRMFIDGRYGHMGGERETRFIAARIWPFIMERWPKAQIKTDPGQLLETKGYLKVRECLEEALENGVFSLIYGPPSSEKSFVLENLCAQYREAGKDAIYIYCQTRHTPTDLLRVIARTAQVWLRANYRHRFIEALRTEFKSRAALPVLVFDEAQHLSIDALETIRDLHEVTRRGPGKRGCGIVLAGSHNLHHQFERRALHLEQWISRTSYRVELSGMSREEVLTLAARAFGNGRPAKLSEAQQAACLKKCTVVDDYANPPRPYFSSRRLLEYIRQQKKNVRSILAENVT
jgi:DNA transposition AAA+ family ATPase